jgi:hypothetical protein
VAKTAKAIPKASADHAKTALLLSTASGTACRINPGLCSTAVATSRH